MPQQDSLRHTGPKTLWRYVFFNLILLILLGAWFWHHNQPTKLPEPQLSPDGKLQCVSYAPYYGKGQTPFLPETIISKAQIDLDLQLLAQRFQCVRIYSVSQGLDYVPESASRLGLKVLLGAWIGWVKAANDLELKIAITRANQYPDTVMGLVVGNEVLLRREQTEAALQAYIDRAQRETKVPVTYADVWEFWLKHKNLENSVDFVTVHVLPYWENIPQSVGNAKNHANRVMNKLSATFTKPLFIGETGWPSVGRQRGESIPSQLNQAKYLREFISLAQNKGWNYNLIEAMDQPWKRDLEGTVGGYWGIYTSDLQAKFDFNGPVAERHDGWQPIYWAMAGLLVWGGLALWAAERRPAALLGMMSLGALAGASIPLQIAYLNAACRDVVEWIALGSMVLAGWLSLINIPFLLTGRLNAVKTWVNPEKLMRFCLLALVTGAAISGWLLATDGRYRDFPLVIYALPALQLSLGLQLLGIQAKAAWYRPYYLLNLMAVSTALVCILLEPGNRHAVLWFGLTILLAFASGLNATLTYMKRT